jgi:phosphoesterase RecJ-like protein
MHTLFERIDAAEHIVLIAHRHPDADSLGSASALYSHLLRLQKKVTLFCATEAIDAHLAYLPWYDKIRHSFPADADLAIAFDCGSLSRLGAEVTCDLVNIDHHSGNEGYGTLAVVDTSAISTTQLLYERFKEAQIPINAKMATALYAGLLDDSRAFTVARTDRRAFEMAADLAGCGADIAASTRHLLQTVSLAATRLKGRMLSSLQLLHEGRVACHIVERSVLEETGARAVDCDAALDESLYLPTVETAVLIRENRDGSLKASLRTRTKRDMAAVAKRFGGGGHAHASGFEVSGMRIDALLEILLEYLEKEVE